MNDLLGDADMADAEIVNWADEIRRERKETAPWHYVNIPHDAAGYDPKRDARPEGTIVSALETQTRILANKRLPREQRIEALKFVIHFVGEVHQPCIVSTATVTRAATRSSCSIAIKRRLRACTACGTRSSSATR